MAGIVTNETTEERQRGARSHRAQRLKGGFFLGGGGRGRGSSRGDRRAKRKKGIYAKERSRRRAVSIYMQFHEPLSSFHCRCLDSVGLLEKGGLGRGTGAGRQLGPSRGELQWAGCNLMGWAACCLALAG